MAKFKAGDIVRVKCDCFGPGCLSGNVAVIKSVDLENSQAILFVPSERKDRGGYRFGTLTKIGHIDETDIPAPLPVR